MSDSTPHISPEELAEAREIATTWTMDAPAIRMAVMVLDLFEQFELLVHFIRDEAKAGLPLPVPIRRIIDASSPASEPKEGTDGA